MFNGASKTTTFVSATRLTALLRAADLTQQGVFNVSVSTPGAASASNTLQFRVGNGLPLITSLSPLSIPAAPSAAVTVTVTGSNFFPDSSVLVDLAARATTFVSSTQLTFSLAPSELGLGRQIVIAVVNSGTGGGQSAPQTLTVTNPVPTVSSIDVNSMLAGAFSQGATITGSNFTPGSFVTVNGQSVGGTVLDSSHIKVTLGTINNINNVPFVTSGTVQIGVSSPAPGGGSSATTLPFTLTPVTPGFSFNDVALDQTGQSVFALPETSTPIGSSLILNSDGRYLAFSITDAFTIHEFAKTFVRDLCTAAASCTPTTFDEVAGFQQSISDVQPTGMYIAYSDSDVFTGAHIELRNTCAGAGLGCVPTSVIISLSDTGAPNVGLVSDPHITPDGRFVSFISTDGTLVHDGLENLSQTSDMFLRDTCIGAPQTPQCTPTTIRISVPLAQRTSTFPFETIGGPLSADARFVTFSSSFPDLVTGVTGGVDAYLRDTCIGAPGACTPATQLVGVRPDGTAYDASEVVAMDASGRFVLFTFNDTNPAAGLALRDTCAVASGCTPSTTLLANGTISGISASADLRFVTFTAPDGCVANDNNNRNDVFVLDTCTGAPAGCTQKTVRLSVNSDGVQSGGGPVTISRDGHTIAFVTFTRNGFVDPPIITVIQNPLP
jgi:hypothetical protein